MISVAICTRDPAEESFRRTVEAVMAQDLARDLWELLVVDNGSSTPVVEMPILVGADVRVIREERPGLTAAKQAAAFAVRGEIVVFVDDDNVLRADYLTTVEEVFANPQIGVVGPAIEADFESPAPAWLLGTPLEGSLVIKRLPNRRSYLSSVPRITTYFPEGAGSCVRTEILRRYFESLTGETRIEGRRAGELRGGEDWDLGLFAIDQGYLVGTSGALRLTHLIPASRMTVDYLTRHAVGSLSSADEIDRKWSVVFGHHVVPYFDGSPHAEIAKAFMSALLPSSRRRVMARFHLQLAKLLLRRRRSNTDR